MGTNALRPAHALVAAGFIMVLVATVGWFFVVETNDPLWRQFLSTVAPPVAYGLIGWAWWQWSGFARAHPATLDVFRRSSRAMAAASLLLSVIYFDSLYRMVRFHLDHPGTYAHFRSGVATNAGEALGFCLAALGFWLASSGPRRAPDAHADRAPNDEVSVGAGVE